MDTALLNKLINEQLIDCSLSLVNAKDIIIDKMFLPIEEFWVNHGYTKQFYLDKIDELYCIYHNILNGGKLDFRDKTTKWFFVKRNAITVWKLEDESYHLATDGMHRILSGKDKNAILPVRIIC